MPGNAPPLHSVERGQGGEVKRILISDSIHNKLKYANRNLQLSELRLSIANDVTYGLANGFLDWMKNAHLTLCKNLLRDLKIGCLHQMAV